MKNLVVLLLALASLCLADDPIKLVVKGQPVDNYDNLVERIEKDLKAGKKLTISVELEGKDKGFVTHTYSLDGWVGKGGTTLICAGGGALKGKILRIPLFSDFPENNRNFEEAISTLNTLPDGEPVPPDAHVKALGMHPEDSAQPYVLVVDRMNIKKDAARNGGTDITLQRFLLGRIKFPDAMNRTQREAELKKMETAFYRFARSTYRFTRIGDFVTGANVTWDGTDWVIGDGLPGHKVYIPAPDGKVGAGDQDTVFSHMISNDTLKGERKAEVLRIIAGARKAADKLRLSGLTGCPWEKLVEGAVAVPH